MEPGYELQRWRELATSVCEILEQIKTSNPINQMKLLQEAIGICNSHLRAIEMLEDANRDMPKEIPPANGGLEVP